MKHNRVFFILIFLLLAVSILVIGLLGSIWFGMADISLVTAIKSIIFSENSKEDLIIRTLRLPRAIVGALIGANLAVAGALMQAITRNPLASPQVFGINAGASLVVVASVIFFPNISPTLLVYSAFMGAALGGIFVYSMGSSGGITPVKLALAGMVVHFFLSSLTEGLIIFNEKTTESVLYWLVGSIDGSTWQDVGLILPWTVIGLVTALSLAPAMTILGLGDDVAKGLGQRIELIRLAAGVTVIVLAGASVAVAGPIGFVGLIIPHIVRQLVGVDYRLVVPFSAIFGASLLVYADILARFIAYPFESPVGIVTALLGTPFFLYLARKGRVANAK